MSCERIRGRDFHSPAARHYTEQAVEELERSEAFQRYVRHVEYSDRLFLTWFLVPFGLTAALYFHLLQFDGAVPLLSSATESPQGLSAVLIVSALVLALYLLPCAVVAPFAGFFDIPDRAESRSLLALFTVVNLFVVSSGATWLNHPPFLETTPPVPWLSGGVPITSALLVAMRRAAPLQGLLVSAYLVSTWRRAFWRTSWHPPFPLLTVPVAVGACGAVTWRLCSVMMPFWCTSDGHFSRALHITVDEGLDLPSSTISMWQFIASRVVQQLMKDADELLTGRLAAKLQVPGVAVELFLAAFSLSFVYFFLVLVKPVVDGLLSLMTSHILPSDPTTWGLALGSCGSALILLLRTENVPPAIVLTVIALCYALLHNGFVA